MKNSVGAIIYQGNKYLIQKRSKKKKIYFPQLYGVFGGGVNKNEKTFLFSMYFNGKYILFSEYI